MTAAKPSSATGIDTGVSKLCHIADNGQMEAVPASFIKNADGSITVVFQTIHFSIMRSLTAAIQPM